MQIGIEEFRTASFFAAAIHDASYGTYPTLSTSI